MIKILTSKQINELDAYTIQHEPIASIDLMERACRAFCSWFTEHFDPSQRVGVVCGSGNNGGDGLGIARILYEWDYPIKVWIVKGSVSESADFKKNRSRLRGVDTIYLSDGFDKTLHQNTDIVIDALFGSGLSRPTEGVYAEVITWINSFSATRVAVDIPSGLLADKPSTGPIVKAHYTVSFQLPKLAFMFPSSHAYVGKWVVVDIGLSVDGLAKASAQNFLLTQCYMNTLIKPYSKYDHKGNRGRALLIAGSYGKIGAAVLAARAVLRSGIGLLTVHIPKSGNLIMQTSVPEAMTSVDSNEFCFSNVPDLTSYDSIGIGPGLGKDPETVKAFGDVLNKFGKPLVIDADAINILGEHRELIQVLPKGSVLTPHHKEFERIAGSWKNDFERLDKQREFSEKYKVVIVYKGAHTTITSMEGDAFFNNTGNAGMATGGMGDVLTGIATALLSSGYSSTHAAQLAVWVHGMAGDEAVKMQGIRGLKASDVTDCLPKVFRKIC